jgi:hypothetical protein
MEMTVLEMTFVVSDPAGWIQALAAVGMLILTGLTLGVLWGYARDTKTLANMSVTQSEDAQKPFVAVKFREPSRFENQGNGPAINVSYEIEVKDIPPGRHAAGEVPAGTAETWTRKRREISPLAPSDHVPIPQAIIESLLNGRRMVLTYESLTGRKYQTAFHITNDGGDLRESTAFGEIDARLSVLTAKGS